MFKKSLIFIFISFLANTFAQENWNYPPISISDANQDAIGSQIAINANDNAIAIWQRYDGSHYIIQTKYSSDGGNTWNTSATDLSQIGQDAGSSHIVLNDSSNAIAIWQRYDGSNYIIQSKYSQDSGVSWSASPTNLSQADQNSSFPNIAMNSSSKAIAVWKRFDGSNYIIQTKYSTDGGVSWSSTPTLLSQAAQDSYIPKIAINDSDNAISIWSGFDGSNFIVQVKYSTSGGVSWNTTPINLSESGENAMACQIALNNSNEAIAIWQRYDGANYIIQAKYSTDGGATWNATATDLSEIDQDGTQPQIAINNLGKAIAIWERFDGNNWIVQTKYSTDSGATWSLSVTDLSLSGRKSWNPNISLTDSDKAIAIWKRYSGYDWIIQTNDSQNAGSTWNATAIDLSTSGQNGYQPEIFMNSSGQAIVIWPRFDDSKWIIQTINN